MQYNVNVLIRELRQAQGLTQERLAEGICSRHTITKIESGERKPDWFILQNVLLRLGIKPEQFQTDISEMVSEGEAEVIKMRDRWQGYLSDFNHEALNDELKEYASKKVEGNSKTLQGRGYQVYLRFKAVLHMHGQYKDSKLCLEYADKHMKLNRPDFDIEKNS